MIAHIIFLVLAWSWALYSIWFVVKAAQGEQPLSRGLAIWQAVLGCLMIVGQIINIFEAPPGPTSDTLWTLRALLFAAFGTGVAGSLAYLFYLSRTRSEA